MKIYTKEIGNCLQCPFCQTVMKAPAKDYCNKADQYVEIDYSTVNWDYYIFPSFCPLPDKLFDTQLEALPKEMKLVETNDPTEEQIPKGWNQHEREDYIIGYRLGHEDGATQQLAADLLVQDKKRAELEALLKAARIVIKGIENQPLIALIDNALQEKGQTK
jgi:hypothetical protein